MNGGRGLRLTINPFHRRAALIAIETLAARDSVHATLLFDTVSLAGPGRSDVWLSLAWHAELANALGVCRDADQRERTRMTLFGP